MMTQIYSLHQLRSLEKYFFCISTLGESKLSKSCNHHKKCLNFQSFLVIILTQNAENSALATPSDTRRPEDDLARGAANAAVEVGKHAVLKPQLSCCVAFFSHPHPLSAIFCRWGGVRKIKTAVSQCTQLP